MFEQSILTGGRTRKPWTVVVAFLGHVVLLGIAILIPLIHYQALPAPELASYLGPVTKLIEQLEAEMFYTVLDAGSRAACPRF
jgi:hypothetical protein